jgi:hypothetical protein
MRELVQNYTFNHLTKQITLTDFVTIVLENILLVNNVTAGTVIFQPNDATKLGTVAGNVLTLAFDTSAMANTDRLQIFYEMSAQPVSGTFWQATQPVSGTVTANIGTTNGLALDATLTGGTQKAIARTAAKGTTTAADLTSTNVDANTQALDVSVKGTVPVSGTFWQSTQPISAASLPLPTGAATSAKQPALGTAGTPSADVITVQGATSMTPVKVDGSGVTQPVSGTVTAVPVDGAKATYRASKIALSPAASATDIFTITGSASKTIRVTRVRISGTETTAGHAVFQLIKRSTANTAGTSASVTAVPLDSNDAAASATVLSYTANPTLGTTIGSIAVSRIFLPAAATATGEESMLLTFGDLAAKALVLRGTSQVLAVNLNGATVTGGSLHIEIEWTEE